MKFSQVVIIYNPHSTGSAHAEASRLHKTLNKERPSLLVEINPTKYAGHARELACKAARKYNNPLIISVSGDGGYNEVINGALQAQAEGARPICAVLPAGNANDHARTVHGKPLAELILSESIMELDVLRIDMTRSSGSVRSRYAHSYVGLGITPTVANVLDKGGRNSSVREAVTVLQTALRMRPIRIRRGHGTEKFDSIICSIIPKMAKVFKISSAARPDDGKFELMTIPHGSRSQLVRHMAKGVFAETGAVSRQADFNCTLPRRTRIQFDGEVVRLAAGICLLVTICPGLLRTIAEIPPRQSAAKKRAEREASSPALTAVLRRPLLLSRLSGVVRKRRRSRQTQPD